MIVQCCLNGARAPGFHPGLPLTPDQLAAAAAAAVAAGAAEIHMHPRAADGSQSLRPEAIGAAVRAVRRRLPGTLIGVSTGAWIEGTPERTLACVEAWTADALPDYASVNLAEPAAPALVSALGRKGVGVEAGLATVADAERLLSLDLAAACLRILVEIRGDAAAAVTAEAAAVLDRLRAAGTPRPLLLHGFEGGVWPLVRMAAARGLSTRVGLEDGTRLPDGAGAADNAELVRAACAILRPR